MHPECFFVVERILIRVLRKINRLQKSTLINASINTSGSTVQSAVIIFWELWSFMTKAWPISVRKLHYKRQTETGCIARRKDYYIKYLSSN